MVYPIIRYLVGFFTVVIYCNQSIDERLLVSSVCYIKYFNPQGDTLCLTTYLALNPLFL